MTKQILLAGLMVLGGQQASAGLFDSAAGLLDTASKATAAASQILDGAEEKTQQAEAVKDQVQQQDLLTTATALLPALTQGLGVTETQAQGGLGSLFQLAQSTLKGSDFATLSQAVPNMSGLLEAAPQVASNETKGLASGLMNMAGLPGDAISSAATVTAQFKQLGLNPAMIPEYIKVTNNFLQSQGGQQTVQLFSQGVAGLL